MSTPFAEAADRVFKGADATREAAALVADMTLAEQLGCLDGDTAFWPGLADMTNGGYYEHPWPAAVVERLGVPGLQFADGPRGAVVADGTAFPVSMARGAMFDPAFEERIGDAIGLELRASGATYTGAVCMNLLRHPAWGRAQETYGEDPHHVGRMAAAFTRGLERHVMACMKHFAVNSMENARFSVDVHADERALHEVYLPHFRHVAEEGIASVMSAYNSLNGEWCGDNETLLTAILRDEWGWEGFVISDFIFGLRDAVRSVRAGLDIEMPFRQQRAMELSNALEDGTLSSDAVVRSVERTVATLLRYHQRIVNAPDPRVVNCAPHRRLARSAASASAVLLTNSNGVLPLDPSASVALVGRLARVVNLGDGGSSDVKSTTAVTPLEGLEEVFSVTHHDDLLSDESRRAAHDADVVVVVVGYTKADEGEYIDNAGTMDLAGELFPPMDHPTLGFAPNQTHAPSPSASEPEHPSEVDEHDEHDDHDEVDEVGGMAKGGDRVSLRLSRADEALIEAAAASNERVVVIVQCGSAVVMPWADSVSVVIVSWYGGVEAGRGLADVLAGGTEPGGRLPFAVPYDEAHLVDFDKDATTATYGLLHGQWKLDADGNDAHFAFGAGQGYTSWTIDAVADSGGVADSSGSSRGDGDTVSVELTNTGERAGSTVVFVHAGMAASAVERAPKRLVGFARVALAAGERRRVVIDVDWSQLDVRRDGGWWTEPGEYQLFVGFDAGKSAVTTSRSR
ncbi:MAG: beta-glucosidase [Ilumatobacter sp.]